MTQQIYSLGLGLTLCLFFFVAPLNAQTINAGGSVRSIQANGDGAEGSGFSQTALNAPELSVGRFVISSGGSVNAVVLYGFLLPDLGEVSNPFLTANLEFSYTGNNTDEAPAFNADLYGIDARIKTIPMINDFFVGPGPDSRGTTTTLQEDVITPSSSTGRITSVDIADFLNTVYDSGLGAKNFAYFRLSPDFTDTSIITGSEVSYLVATANNSDNALHPSINFTVASPVLLGDVNLDNQVDFSDIGPFISRLAAGAYQVEADIDQNEVVSFDDIAPFITILSQP
ncbi:hypothetical protein N9Y42_11335 [Mariniblastus sp.]|nr:hypothetical protein [Mariniblastus sp.]